MSIAAYAAIMIATQRGGRPSSRRRGQGSKFPFRAVGKALIEGDPGVVKIVADAETDRILGMHAVGPHVSELIAEGVFAKLVEGTPQELGMRVHAHPSLAEIVSEAAMAVDGLANSLLKRPQPARATPERRRCSHTAS